MKAIFCGLLAVTPALIAAQVVGSNEESTASLHKLEQRVRVAERQAKTAAASLSAVRQESVRAAKQLDEAQAAMKAQAAQLEGIKSAQAAIGLRVDSVAAQGESQSLTLATSVASRSTVFAVLLGATLLLLAGGYWHRYRQRGTEAKSVGARIDQIQASVRDGEERVAKVDAALSDSLLEALSRLKAASTPSSVGDSGQAPDIDHNLPTKLADEIHRMRKRFASLPEETKGLTPLKKSLERLETELSAYGYEIVDHSGKPYSENLSVKARFIPSDELAPDERVISKVVVPQLNYRGVLVRMADVEVSIGA